MTGVAIVVFFELRRTFCRLFLNNVANHYACPPARGALVPQLDSSDATAAPLPGWSGRQAKPPSCGARAHQADSALSRTLITVPRETPKALATCETVSPLARRSRICCLSFSEVLDGLPNGVPSALARARPA